MKDELFEVKLLKIPEFNETGEEISDDEHYAVCNKSKGSMNFVCYDKRNADDLCDFLNNECIFDTDFAVDAFVLDNCIEWGNLINELSKKEVELNKVKDEYDEKEFEILYVKDIDFKGLYGAANDKTRKHHVTVELEDLIERKDSLEMRINYLKRRLSFLKSLVSVKTALIEVKK